MTDPLDAVELHDVLDALHVALLGPDPSPSARALALHPRAAAPLAADADVRVVDAGPGLWGVLRTSQNGHHQLLCVHNATAEERVFDPAPHLPAADGDSTPLFFLGGRVESEAGPDGAVLCRLRPRSFTWLGRSTVPSDAPATTLEAHR